MNKATNTSLRELIDLLKAQNAQSDPNDLFETQNAEYQLKTTEFQDDTTLKLEDIIKHLSAIMDNTSINMTPTIYNNDATNGSTDLIIRHFTFLNKNVYDISKMISANIANMIPYVVPNRDDKPDQDDKPKNQQSDTKQSAQTAGFLRETIQYLKSLTQNIIALPQQIVGFMGYGAIWDMFLNNPLTNAVKSLVKGMATWGLKGLKAMFGKLSSFFGGDQQSRSENRNRSFLNKLITPIKNLLDKILNRDTNDNPDNDEQPKSLFSKILGALGTLGALLFAPVKAIGKILLTSMSLLATGFNKLADKLGDTRLGTKIKNSVTNIWDNLKIGVGWVAAKLGMMFRGIGPMISRVLPAIGRVLASTTARILGAITAFGADFVIGYAKGGVNRGINNMLFGDDGIFGAIFNVMKYSLAGASIGGAIGAVGGPVGAAIGALIGAAIGAVTGVITSIARAWVSNIFGEEVFNKRSALEILGMIDGYFQSWIGDIFDTFGSWVTEITLDIGKWFVGAFNKAGTWITETAISLGSWLHKQFDMMTTNFMKWLKSIPGRFEDWFTEITLDLGKVIDDIVGGLITWINDITGGYSKGLAEGAKRYKDRQKELAEEAKLEARMKREMVELEKQGKLIEAKRKEAQFNYELTQHRKQQKTLNSAKQAYADSIKPPKDVKQILSDQIDNIKKFVKSMGGGGAYKQTKIEPDFGTKARRSAELADQNIPVQKSIQILMKASQPNKDSVADINKQMGNFLTKMAGIIDKQSESTNKAVNAVTTIGGSPSSVDNSSNVTNTTIINTKSTASSSFVSNLGLGLS